MTIITTVAHTVVIIHFFFSHKINSQRQRGQRKKESML